MAISLKGRLIRVSGADSIANINWLLDHGARVTVVGARNGAEMEKRIDEHLKRTVPDGKAYEQVRARLTWSSDRTIICSDLHQLFLSVWKKRIIGITGKHGKTTTAVWAAHLIGDAVVAGHIPERPILPAADSRAHIAVIKLPSGSPGAKKVMTVSTDAMPNREAAIAAARLAGISENLIQHRLNTLPQAPLRQEVIHKSPKITVVNDAMANHPARGIAALRQWGGPTCIIICGGDDSKSDYREWAGELQKHVRRTNVVFLTGSATTKMRAALGPYGRGIRAFDSLESALKAARARAGLYVSSVILFSPAAKNFGLFADEYDRGQQFNSLVSRQR